MQSEYIIFVKNYVSSTAYARKRQPGNGNPCDVIIVGFCSDFDTRSVIIKYCFHQQVMRESDNLEIPVTSSSSASRVKKQGHWLLKERSPSEQQLQSMPPIVVGSLKDSGIGTEDQEGFTRSGPNRSSFGMALKVCFRFS